MKEISREILKTLAQNFVDTNWDTIINDIATLVTIPSVADFEHATPEHPSGKAAYEALECALGIARRLGLRGENEAGEIAYADLPGDNTQEENMLA
ncbi:MAG: hypothetical protein IJV62_00345, partial [Eggerthellaceae bacterium]|nr:hypothetical protein [Eggerthellaceae bacterium]